MKQRHPKTVAELKKIESEELETISILEVQATFEDMVKVYFYQWVARNGGNEYEYDCKA